LVQPEVVNYYPCAVSQGEINLDQLAEKLSFSCTLTKADCYAAVVGLTEVITEALGEGKIVRLDNLGTFSVSLQGNPSPTIDGIGKSAIKTAKINFKPSAAIRKKLNKFTFKKLKP
jgi:predicted histone-like DNA-binding protein